MDTKHTPTPWYASATAGHDTHGHTVICSEINGNDVAIVYDGDANADFIVEACNLHDELVAALKCIASVPLPGEAGALKLSRSDAMGFIRTARAVLAKCEKGE